MVAAKLVMAEFSVPSTDKAFWAETFQSQENVFDGGVWVKSKNMKYLDQKISIKEGPKLMGKFAKDTALVMENKAQHFGFSAKLPSPFVLDGSPEKSSLVIQYEVKYREGSECAGTYLKLLRDTPDLDLRELNEKTPFTIMFGPDRCDKVDNVHFIFNHKNPSTGTFEEKKLDISPATPNDKLSHVYTLVINDDNSFEILMDQKVIKNGSLYSHFKPSVNPPKEIDDPTDLRPEAEFIPDPHAKKPANWDEDAPRTVPNHKFVKPEDWDETERGPWRVR